MTPCLDDETLLKLGQGQLDAAGVGTIDEHLDTCASCRTLVAELARVQAPDATGTKIGRYDVRELIGSGAMGLVYSGHDPELDRPVAIKLLRPREGAAVDARAHQLKHEAQAMARVRHPNVVAVHDVGTHDGQPWVAMELVAGPSLRTWLATPRPRAQVLAVLAQAGAGLAAAHHAGVVHRDFKPDNVIVDERGQARVTDFGLASTGAGTAPGALIGTPAYMAPEQIAGAPADARSDQFSYCVTLFEALTGRRPFVGRTLNELAQAARAGPDPHGLPSYLHAVLRRGLSADPHARFESMAALLAALDRRPLRRLPWLIAVASALVLLIGALALRPEGCDGPRWVAEVWTPEARASAGPHRDRIEQWAAALAALKTSTCDRPAPARETCLEARRQELVAWLASRARPAEFPRDVTACTDPKAYDADPQLEADLARAAVTNDAALATALVARAHRAGLRGAERRARLLTARTAADSNEAARTAAEVVLSATHVSDTAMRAEALAVMVRALLATHPRIYDFPGQGVGERSTLAMELGLASHVALDPACHSEVSRRRARSDYRPLFEVMTRFDAASSTHAAEACSWVGFLTVDTSDGWGNLWLLYDGLKIAPMDEGLTAESESRWLKWLDARGN